MNALSITTTSAEANSGVLANQALVGQVSQPTRLHTTFVPVAVKDLSKLPADVQTRLVNSRFDAAIHKMMNEARCDADWLLINQIGLNAIKAGNWRNALKKRFMAEAPNRFVLQHQVKLGLLPKPNPKAPSPLGNETAGKKWNKSERRQRDAAACPKYSNGHGKKGK